MTDDTLRAAVRRLLDEYWEDNSRPPSFVTIGDLKNALAASATDEGPDERNARYDAAYRARPAVPALDATDEGCGCTFDSSEPNGVCPQCHHREHGTSGCPAVEPPGARAALAASAADEPPYPPTARQMVRLAESAWPEPYYSDPAGLSTDLAAVVREARPAVPVALDVERLAKAIEATDCMPTCGDCGADIDYHGECPEGDGHLVWEVDAKAIAREYAALQEQTDDR